MFQNIKFVLITFLRVVKETKLIITILLFPVPITALFSNDDVKKNLVYVGRFAVSSEKDFEFDLITLTAIRKSISGRLSDSSNVKIEEYYLSEFNNSTADLYEAISEKEKKVLFVIDNLWGGELVKGTSVIENSGLEVIALNADKKNDEGKILYIDPSDLRHIPLSDYIAMIKKYSPEMANAEIIFVGEYIEGKEYQPSKKLKKELLKKKLPSNNELVLNCEKELFEKDKIEALTKFRSDLKSLNLDAKRKYIIILVVHKVVGNEILIELAEKFKESIIIGEKFILSEKLKKDSFLPSMYDNKNRLILLQQPYDRVEKRDRELLEQLKNNSLVGEHVLKFPERTLIACQRANILVDFIEGFITGQTRVRPYEYVQSHNSFETSYVDYQFGSKKKGFIDNAVLTSPVFGEYLYYKDSSGRYRDDFVSAKFQLPKNFWEIKLSEENQEILTELNLEHNLYIDLNIINIYKVSSKDKLFSAEIELSLFLELNALDSQHLQKLYPELEIAWNGEKFFFVSSKSQSVQYDLKLPPWLAINNIYRKNSLGGRAIIDGDHLRVRYQINGDFTADFDLFDYPLDKQTLLIGLTIYDNLHISSDRVSKGIARLFKDSNDEVDLQLVSGWKHINSLSNFKNVSFDSNRILDFGSNAENVDHFQSYFTEITIERKKNWAYLRIIVPYVAIGLGIILISIVSNKEIHGLVDISLGLFLAILSLSLSLSDIVRTGTIISKIDIIYIIMFTAALLNFFLVTGLHSGILKFDLKTSNIKTNILKKFIPFVRSLIVLLVIFAIYAIIM